MSRAFPAGFCPPVDVSESVLISWEFFLGTAPGTVFFPFAAKKPRAPYAAEGPWSFTLQGWKKTSGNPV